MIVFEAIGIVPEITSNEFGLPVTNAAELLQWWSEKGVDTRLSVAGSTPIIRVRGSFASECSPGTRIVLTIETVDRRNGRGIRTVGVRRVRGVPNPDR